MSHFSEKYVGMEYVHNEFDCVHLLQLVQQNEFDRTVDIPVERDDTVFAMSNQIDFHKAEYAETVSQSESKDGDIVLMKAKGRLNHTGILFIKNGTHYVLHNLRNVGSVAVHKIRELEKWGLIVEGIYRFK